MLSRELGCFLFFLRNSEHTLPLSYRKLRFRSCFNVISLLFAVCGSTARIIVRKSWLGLGCLHLPFLPSSAHSNPCIRSSSLECWRPVRVRKMSDTVTVQNVRLYCQIVANFTGVQFLLTWLHYCIISRPSGGKMSSSDPLEERRARVVRKATSVNFRFGGKRGRAAPRKKF